MHNNALRTLGLVALFSLRALAVQPDAEALKPRVAASAAAPQREGGPMKGMLIGGGVAFLASYLPVLALAVAGEQPLLAVPVVGSSVYGVQALSARGDYAGVAWVAGGLALANAAIQLAGLTLFSLGFIIPALTDSEAGATQAARVVVAPGAGGVLSGATLTLVGF